MIQLANTGRSKTIGLALLLLAALLSPTAAWAWTHAANFGARLHGHEFSRATLENRDCRVKVQVFFDAPAEAYKHPIPERNVYRFHARIKLDAGRLAVTRVFNNFAAGARAYSFSHDTKGEGCWARTEGKIVGVDVEGCRGAGCTPEPFK